MGNETFIDKGRYHLVTIEGETNLNHAKQVLEELFKKDTFRANPHVLFDLRMAKIDATNKDAMRLAMRNLILGGEEIARKTAILVPNDDDRTKFELYANILHEIQDTDEIIQVFMEINAAINWLTLE